MFDHIGIGVTDLDASKQFFLQALEPIGVTVVMEGPYGVGLGQHGKPSLWFHETEDKPVPIHIAFTGRRSMRSTVPHWRPAARTTAVPVSGRNTIRTTTARSSSVPTTTTSRSCATRRRPERSGLDRRASPRTIDFTLRKRGVPA